MGAQPLVVFPSSCISTGGSLSRPPLYTHIPQVRTEVLPPSNGYDPDTVPCKSGTLGELVALVEPMFICHVKPRQEKVLAWELDRHGYEFFIPLLDRVRQSGRQRYVVREPVFQQYLFVVGGKDIQGEIYGLPSKRVLRNIQVSDADQPQLRAELHAIDLALSSNQRIIDTCPYAVPGRRVRITAGALMGCEGTVVRRDDKSAETSVVLQVSILGQGVEVSINSDLLEAAG